MTSPLLKMNNGLSIPSIGFGVYRIPDGEETENAVLTAFKLGYRLIDTAHRYGNEKSVGSAVKKSGLKREDIFVTSKIWPSEFGKDTGKALDNMLKRLDLDYIDLVLLHWPFGDYVAAYQAMEEKVKEGKIKSIGLSNFVGKSLDDILKICKIKPVLNQLECHPFKNNLEIKKILDKDNIIIESWYPIGHADKELMSLKIFEDLGKKYNKTITQIILRWHIQNGFLPIPKSTNPKHIEENMAVFDFKLTDEEMKEINEIPQKEIWKPHGGSMKGMEEYCLGMKLDD